MPPLDTSMPHRGIADRPHATDDTPLHEAYRCLWKALECGSSPLRVQYLFRAADALDAAKMPIWAKIAHVAALPIRGDDRDVRRLMRAVDGEIKRRESRT